MRNRALHDALRDFALEAAALLSEDVAGGAELEFDVTEESPRGGPSLYRYTPLTEKFIASRWQRLRELPSCGPAANALGTGAAQYLRVSGLRGEEAEPALHAMLERLYEDATSFGFPEERFERVYGEVERMLFRDTLPATVLAPLPGLWLEAERVELGDGLALVRGESFDAPPEAIWPEHGGEPRVLCVLQCDVEADEPLPAAEAAARFRRLVTGLRLLRPGAVTLGAVGWRRAAEGRWQPFELGGCGEAHGDPWVFGPGDEAELGELLGAVERFSGAGSGFAGIGSVGWALERFELGCGRRVAAQAVSDYLLALRALLDATSEAGHASLSLRFAALCAEEGGRRAMQRRLELAFALERFLMAGGRGESYADAVGSVPPEALTRELERNLRALLRDVICGYLDPELKLVADDILLESPGQLEIAARDLRAPEPEPEPEPQPDPETEPRPAGRFVRIDEDAGVTPSVDWLDEDPQSYSAPV